MQIQEESTGTKCPRPPRRQFDFSVDAERLIAYSEGDTAELTVREVLDMSGNQPAEEYHLIEFSGPQHHERVKHEDLNELLHIKPHARYAAVFRGCTPVS